jgi:hypothetical protein
VKNVRSTSCGILGVAFLCCASSLLADANLTLTGAGANGVLGGVYVGPYQGTINGISTLIICDDFFDETYFNESWTATASTFSDLSNTKFGAANLVQYQQAAWLTLQLLNPPISCPTTPSNCAGDIQFAIWQVFDHTGSNQPFGLLTGSDLSNANYWLTQAQHQVYTSGEFSNFAIYTAVSCSQNCPSWPAQEFLVKTPEPPELALLGIDLSGVGALLLLFRRYRRCTS